MQLHTLTFSNYKPFGDEEQTLKLRPLTLLFGKNNSGKSAVARLPRLLLGALAAEDGPILPLRVGELRYGDRFLDLVHQHTNLRRLMLDLQATHGAEALALRAELYLPSSDQEAPLRIWSRALNAPTQRPSPTPQALANDHLLPQGDLKNRWITTVRQTLALSQHLGPLRARVVESYLLHATPALTWDGAHAPQWLAADAALAGEVGRWFEANLDGWFLSIDRVLDSVSLKIRRGQAPINLSYAGEGFQQVLPVVTQQYKRQREQASGFIDIIEQPELHLHAAAQAPLGDLFLETARRCEGQTLVETNSKTLLLRVQRRVAEGAFDPDRLGIYFIEADDKGSRLREATLSAEGELSWSPPGIFEEDFREVAAIRRAQRARAAVTGPSA
jgi:hypothetical protein